MDKERFERLVANAVAELPEEFRSYMENVDIVVEDLPSVNQMRAGGIRKNQILLGLYEGIPHIRRGSHYGLVPPDKITIFQKNIEALCRTDEEIIFEISRVVYHEIAHHFGITDARLRQLENEKRNR